MIALPPALHPILESLQAHQITPIVVGGYVRDALLEKPSKDIDIELYNISSLEEVETILKPFGKLNLVGKSFGVLKLRLGELEIDFSPPRTESKQGSGHKGFDVRCDFTLDFTAAARRRDFTINAMGYNPQTKMVLDPYNGLEDLRCKKLACVDEKTFVEDPLRVLRAVQFAARYDLVCNENLLRLCRVMIENGALTELPKERIFEELKKLLLLSRKPSIGFELLRQMGGLPFFTPLDQLETTPQDPASHPEGSVWIHTMMALDSMAGMRTGDTKRDCPLMLAVLLHDIGKPSTTVMENALLNAPRHAHIGVDIAQSWLWRITEDKFLINAVLPLIAYHGTPRKLYRNQSSDSDILRLSTHVSIENLVLVAHADFFGRAFDKSCPEYFEAGEWLYLQAKKLGVLRSPPKPLLMGRDLITLGLIPSQQFKNILDTAYEAQLNQQFFTRQEAIQWLKRDLVITL